MRHSIRTAISLAVLGLAVFANAAAGQTPAPSPAPSTGKNPVIVVPGITGSELINKDTGKTAWFHRSRAKDDDVRLPMSANLARNSDALIAGDIIREVRIASILPEIEIYAKLIDALQTTGGYREAKWDAATNEDAADTFFVFSYDWRRDNVENARLLIERIETLKRKIGKPDLKFNVIAHSMGGLISRYAAMYGNVDIPASKPRPSWSGARHLDKVFLVGTPNEGSLLAFDALLNGVSYIGGGVNLPFIQDLTRFDVFTIPSIFQLLPHERSMLAYDEELQPLNIDIYDPAAWEEYDWAIWKDKNFSKRFSANEQENARPYFRAAIERARRFQEALNATSNAKVPVSFYLLGAECKDTPTAMVLRRDEKRDRWITQFKADSFTNSLGIKITSEMLKPIIYTPGDSVVPKRSLEAATLRANGYEKVLPIMSELYQCESHGRLVTNPEIQQKLFGLINSTSTAQNAGTQP